MINVGVFVLVILCLVEAKETAFLPSCFDWTDTSCWSNGIPQDNDDVYLSSCPSSPVVLSSILSLNFLQIGDENCGFDLSFAPGSTLTVFQFSFFGGTLSGSGLITLQGPATFVSDIAKELHVSVLVQDSLLVDTTSPIFFKGSGSVTSSGTVSFISDTVLQYSPDHDHQGQSQPVLSNQGTMYISVPTELRIDIPFINHDVININSGTFHCTNPHVLMGNYIVHSKLLITTDSDFRRGVLLEGNGEIEIGENIGVTFDGNFLLDGNVILRSGATLDFLSYSRTRFFFSNLTECNSKVTWNAGSRMDLRGLDITSDCGDFTIKSDAQWNPHSSFNSHVHLTGTSVFTVESGTDDFILHNVELFQQAQIIAHRTVLLNVFSFFGGYLAGTGSIVLPTSATVTTDSYKEIAVDVFNNGELVFECDDRIILAFRDSFSWNNSDSVSILSDTSFLLADGQVNNDQLLSIQGSLEVKGNSTFQVDVLFSNTEDIYVELGSQLIINIASQVTLDGCSSTFKNNGDLLVMNGTLIFKMNLFNRGSILVESFLRFCYCQFSIDNTVSTTSSGSIIIDSPTTFTSQSLLIGNGTITFASDSIVQGIVDLTGCVEVSTGVDVFFYNATIIQMNLCSVKGNVSFNNSTITFT
ncbi:hypothetical protein GEMRC1_010468 [Eukaryota sp. GEM-RC1]